MDTNNCLLVPNSPVIPSFTDGDIKTVGPELTPPTNKEYKYKSPRSNSQVTSITTTIPTLAVEDAKSKKSTKLAPSPNDDTSQQDNKSQPGNTTPTNSTINSPPNNNVNVTSHPPQSEQNYPS